MTTLSLWLEALSSCAIEGNRFAQEMLRLWETDKLAFFQELRRVEESESEATFADVSQGHERGLTQGVN